MKLILGESPIYNRQGQLQNSTVTSKYAGEKELADLLDDNNWKVLGACEITCVGVYDTNTGEQDEDRMHEVNDSIASSLNTKKIKSKLELLIEQNKKLEERLSKLDGGEVDIFKKYDSEDEELEALKEQYTRLYGKKPNHLMKIETLKEKIALKL